MSYLGEYLVPPVRQSHNEGDPYLREFRAVKHFPALRAACSRTAHLGGGQVRKGRVPSVGPVTPPTNDPMLRSYGSNASVASVSQTSRRSRMKERKDSHLTEGSIVSSASVSMVSSQVGTAAGGRPGGRAGGVAGAGGWWWWWWWCGGGATVTSQTG